MIASYDHFGMLGWFSTHCLCSTAFVLPLTDDPAVCRVDSGIRDILCGSDIFIKASAHMLINVNSLTYGCEC